MAIITEENWPKTKGFAVISRLYSFGVDKFWHAASKPNKGWIINNIELGIDYTELFPPLNKAEEDKARKLYSLVKELAKDIIFIVVSYKDGKRVWK